MGKNNQMPHGSRKHAQMRLAAGAVPAGYKRVAGFLFTDAAAVPDNMAQYSSATWSLSSPVVANQYQFAVTVFSLGSTDVPANLQRIAILPEQ